MSQSETKPSQRVEKPSATDVTHVLIVVPTLNEEDHIKKVIEELLVGMEAFELSLIVADGGSTDQTRAIVSTMTQTDPRIHLINNPDRIQSAGINRACDAARSEIEFLVRADAHADYPPGYCAILVEEARQTGADAVVVPMKTIAEKKGFQTGVAAAQNSFLGTGGAAHRTGDGGKFVDHGHHALMTMRAFRSVGGYDPTFAQNEDAELDHRLHAAGFSIWMTDRTFVTYFPRSQMSSLARQYWRYGRGRARMLRKHALTPKPRQMLPVAVPLATGLALAGLAVSFLTGAFGWMWLSVPLLFWILIISFYCSYLTIMGRKFDLLWSGPAAMIMHAAWGAGFLRERLGLKK